MKFKLISAFLISIAIIFSFLYYTKEQKIQYLLNQKTKEFETLYNAVYNQYKEEADLINELLVNNSFVTGVYQKLQNANETEKDRLRKELYEYIKEDYDTLKLISIRQLHFHLKNNDSFLRMHRPNKFGDNLTDVRPTIAYVNKNHEKIDGFEEGRIFNGFRFVFPISKNDTHLGSIEVSFSAVAIITKIATQFNKQSNLHIRKDVVDEKVFSYEKINYKNSPFEGYLIDKEVFKKINKKSVQADFLEETKIKALQSVKNFKNNTFYDKKIKKTLTILSIKNPLTNQTIAFISTLDNAKNITTMIQNYYSLFSMSILLLAVIFYFIYHQLKTKKELKEKLLEQKEIILKEQNKTKEKDRILFQQSKMASLSDMLENIAHQWRQPLSAISTNASGMEAEFEFGVLKDENLKKGLQNIISSSEELSRTIDDFRNFFRPEKQKSFFFISSAINKTLQIIEPNFKSKSINIVKKIQDTQIQNYENELIQVLINILNNAKDALGKVETPKYIFIDIYNENDQLVIDIKDNANGIEENIISKVFEPYFTTKHKSQGTGIGLFMSEELVVKHMKGRICAKNVSYDYDGMQYHGALFTIKLPVNYLEEE
jgi:signal transduction histidine kinase